MSNTRRGRPKGVKNGEGTHQLAPIKNWKPWMTKVVILHMAGVSREAISKEFPSKKDPSKFLSTARITQILRDPSATQIMRGMEAKIKEKMEVDIEEGMFVLAEKGMKRLAETLDETFAPGSDAHKHQDNVSLTLVKNFVPGEKEAKKRDNAPPLNEKLTERLITALEKSNEARQIHSGDIKDGDFEIEKAS